MTQANVDDHVAQPPADSARLFWRFWAALTVSGAGTAVTSVAMQLLAVLTLKSSSAQVGLLTAAGDAAWLVIGLPAGVIVSRLPLRGAQVAMDLIRAAVLFSVPVAAALHVLYFPQLVIVALVIGLASVVFDVGNSTFLPAIVSADELTRRNSLTSGSAAAVELGGPSLGGLLVQLLSAPACLLIDAVSYVLSAVLLLGLPRPAAARTASQGAAPSTGQLIRGGWRFVLRHPVIAPCATAATLFCLTIGALMALTPVYLVRTLGTPAALVGVVIATEGLGGLIGAALAAPMATRLGSARALLTATAWSAVSVLLLPLASHGWGLLVFAAGSIGFGAGVVLLSTLTRTHRQTVTPRELLPRVMATVRFVSWGAIPVGSLLAGYLASASSNRTALWLAAVPTVITPLALWFSPIRRQRDLA